MEIGAIIGGVVGGVITVAGYFFITRWLNLKADEREKQREEKDKLKVHFKDLKDEGQSKVSTMISSQYEWQRKINVFDSSPSPTGIELSDLSNSFAVHFPEEAKDYSEYKQKIIEHNKKYEQFRLAIKEYFASKGIPTASASAHSTTSVYDITFIALFSWQEDLVKNDPHPQPDFTHIDTKQDATGHYLYASGLGASPVAYAKTDSDKDKLERALLEVAQNKKYRGETAKMLDSHKSLSQELQSYRSHLDKKLEDIEKYWPGLKGQEFRKVKACPRYKEIFH